LFEAQCVENFGDGAPIETIRDGFSIVTSRLRASRTTTPSAAAAEFMAR